MTRIAAFAITSPMLNSPMSNSAMSNSAMSKSFSAEGAQKSTESNQKSSLFGKIKAFANSEKLPETLNNVGSALISGGLFVTGAAALSAGASIIPGVAMMATGGLLYGAGAVISCIQNYQKSAQADESKSTNTLNNNHNSQVADDNYKSWPSNEIANSM